MGTPDADGFRIGHGYDLHRLEPPPPAGAGRPFILGGLRLEHERGPVGHSDGDALYHAVTDAVLGALGRPDIGAAFPDDDPRWAGADSAVFIEAAAQHMRDDGWRVASLDVTVVCERPKIRPHAPALRAQLAARLGCGDGRVNVKGKTHEGVDAVGEGRAIEVHAVVLLARATPETE